MKILFITYSIKENTGVGSARSRMFYNLLLERGHKITLLCDESYSIKNIFKNLLFNNYDKVYFSGPPYTYYLISVLICVLLKNFNLIVDFRDAWSINVKYGYGTGKCNNKIKLKIIEFIERLLYKKSCKFVVCTKGMNEQYGSLFNDFEKIELIENGHEYLLEDLKKEKILSTSPKVFICIGQFFSYDVCKSIKIIDELNSFAHSNDIEVLFIGTDKVTYKYLNDNKSTLHFKIQFLERVSYKNLKLYIKNADVGLLIIRDENIDYGTKVFDYIGLGLPIFSKFDFNKNFYKRFKHYIVENLNDIPEVKPDYEMNFSRRRNLEKLVKCIEE